MNGLEQIPQWSPEQRFQDAIETIVARVQMNRFAEQRIERFIPEDHELKDVISKASNGTPSWLEIIKRSFLEEGVADPHYIVNFIEYLDEESLHIVTYRIDEDSLYRRAEHYHPDKKSRIEELGKKLKGDEVNEEVISRLSKLQEDRRRATVHYLDDPEGFEAVLELLKRISP